MASGSGPAAKKKTTVEFVGPGREVTERILNASDFERGSGDKGPGKTTWNAENDWTVDASDWSPKAIEFMKKQSDFKVHEDVPAEPPANN